MRLLLSTALLSSTWYAVGTQQMLAECMTTKQEFHTRGKCGWDGKNIPTNFAPVSKKETHQIQDVTNVTENPKAPQKYRPPSNTHSAFQAAFC